MDRNKKIKVAIIVLAVLLGISLVVLCGILLHDKLADNNHSAATAPGNVITSDDDTNASDDETGTDADGQATPGKTDNSKSSRSADKGNTTANNTSGSQTAAANTVQTAESTVKTKEASTIELYKKHSEDNTPFNVGNMFPGDSITKYFCVQVSYKDEVTVHYRANVRKGYEKLAEVLKVRVTLLTTGETMYDGLMRDMPESVSHKLTSVESTTDELYYEITAYLDTSVGNEYQNKDLIADFNWWVEETGNLQPIPKTGDNTNMLLWICLAAIFGGAMIVLLFVRRRREEER